MFIVLSLLKILGLTATEIDGMISTLRLSFIKKYVPPWIRNKIPRRQIDWNNTRAYCPSGSSMAIRINKERRETAGIVKENEYHELRDEIIKRLRSLKNQDGDLVFEDVLSAEEYYKGAYIQYANDIILFLREMNYQISPELLSQVLTPFETYVHKMNGLFIAAGPNIAATGDLKREISILDVAPTIMHLAGLSVPDDMDGQVQNEIFKDGSEPTRRRVSYRKSDYEKLRMIERIHKLKELGRL